MRQRDQYKGQQPCTQSLLLIKRQGLNAGTTTWVQVLVHGFIGGSCLFKMDTALSNRILQNEGLILELVNKYKAVRCSTKKI